ncbi:hypothetical protein BKA83DRAFT_4127635 [Pisolithus microcarpus]|nr:hypothetical protein BKA83DRAFT_4127635 [Pisolithus microcarpus]
MAIFKTICEYMSTRLESGSLEDVLKQWNNSMCNLLSDNHGHFFVRLMTTHNVYYKQINSHVPGSGEEVEQEEQLMEQDKQLEEHEKKVTTSMLGFKDMITAYLTMRNSLDVLFNSGEVHKPKLVIALDEAHSLSMVTPYKYHPLTILCRAISLYSGGAARVVESTRVFMDGQLIFPPYSQLRWKSIQEDSVEEIIAIAISKLHGINENRNVLLTVLSQRFCLHVTFGHHEAVEFLASSVASHLQVCIFFSKDHNWGFTTYPSEPFLSCAAASVLNDKFNLDKHLWVLEDKIISGMINVGKSGELASQLLWLHAKDVYICCTSPASPVIQAADGQEWKSELIDCQTSGKTDNAIFHSLSLNMQERQL